MFGSAFVTTLANQDVSGDALALAGLSDAEGDVMTIITVGSESSSVGQVTTLPGSGASTVVNEDGSFIIPPGDAFDSLGAGDSATETVFLTVSGGSGEAGSPSLGQAFD